MKSRLRPLRVALIAFALVFTGIADAQTAAAPTTISFADVLHHYQVFNTWSAALKNEYLAKAYNSTKSAPGTVRYQRPDTIEIVSNGQAITTSCAQASSLLFLCGPQAAAGFTFQQIAAPTMNFADGIVFVATPVVSNSKFVKLIFYVDWTTLDVRRAMVIDAQGNRNRSDFDNVQTTYWH